MFGPRWKSTGIRHTTTVAFFIVAFIFTPAVSAIAGDFSSYRGVQFVSHL